MSQSDDPQLPGAPGPPARAEAAGERSVAIAGDNYGIALTGDNAQVVALPAEVFRPPAEVDAPRGLTNLPMRPHLFVGRNLELDRLDAALAAPGQVVVQAVHGLGGIGKSTLAARWSATRARGYAAVRWINAESEASIQKGLADLATALQPPLAGTVREEVLAERALQWLATHDGWLLILDNVNDPADIAALLARSENGRFLITSRLAGPWRHATTVIRLDILNEAESLELLTRIITAAGVQDLDGAAELCAELGDLPLAIEQAAAYLVQSQLTTPSPRAYLDLLAQYPADLYRDGAVGVPGERTIARIWRLTLERIAAAQPIAADLLRTLAWYAPDHIPVAVLADFARPPDLNRAVGLLIAYSMITPEPASGTLSIHRLVQAVARTPDPDDPNRAAADIARAQEQATILLLDSFPNIRKADFGALFTNAPDASCDTEAFADLMLRMASTGYLGIAGVARAQDAYERILGPDHAKVMNCKRFDPDDDGMRWEAEKSLANSLARYKRSKGIKRKHAEFVVLDQRLRLAEAYCTDGDAKRAIPIYEAALAQYHRVARKSSETVECCCSLADAYVVAGDLDRAITLYEDTLSEHQKGAGVDHPVILAIRHGLARAYRQKGDLDRSIALYETTLASSMRKLGPDAHRTLFLQLGLADTYRAAGKFAQTISLYETIIEWLEKNLRNHPYLQAYRSKLSEIKASVSQPENLTPPASGTERTPASAT
jgi:tetratricopeptide (TPR) repeat protein